MAETPRAVVRVPPDLAEKALGQHPDTDLSTLLRAGLILLVGMAGGRAVTEALARSRTRPGPKPKGPA